MAQTLALHGQHHHGTVASFRALIYIYICMLDIWQKSVVLPSCEKRIFDTIHGGTAHICHTLIDRFVLDISRNGMPYWLQMAKEFVTLLKFNLYMFTALRPPFFKILKFWNWLSKIHNCTAWSYLVLCFYFQLDKQCHIHENQINIKSPSSVTLVELFALETFHAINDILTQSCLFSSFLYPSILNFYLWNRHSCCFWSMRMSTVFVVPDPQLS